MTFTEAAAQVLRLVGKPLHYKEITDVAIEKNLLSHVGKSPEVTMGARLAAVVKKEDESTPLVRVKPGVFALRDWDQATIDRGLADRTPALEYLSKRESNGEADDDSETVLASSPVAVSEEDAPRDAAELQRAEMAAHAREFFDVEEDDDEPIFGSDEESDEAPESDEDSRGGRGRRRRRRRNNNKGSDSNGGDDLPSYTVSDAPLDLDLGGDDEDEPRESRSKERERGDRERGDRDRERGDRDRERGDRDRDKGRDRDRGDRDRDRGDRDRDRGDRDRDRGARDRDRGGRDRDRGDRDRDRDRGDRDKRPDAEGDVADVLASIIFGIDRRGGFVAIKQVAETASRKHNLAQDVGQAMGLVNAALRADNLKRAARGERQRFRFAGGRVSCTDGSLDGELRRLEEEIQGKVQRYQEQTRRQLLRRFQDLPQRALADLIALLFERLGYTNVAHVRRPGGNELHFSAKSPDYAGGVQTAIVVRKDGKEVGRERVTELRGSLHHYGPAYAGFMLTTGQVLSGAREEAQVAGAAPVMLLDGFGLATLCEQQGVGVQHTRVVLPVLDVELFDALKGS
ncbi:MAG: restriction endonuclease [Myxococcales bacterium]|nr:restriction endonuclease [Myxococcales bacterium]